MVHRGLLAAITSNVEPRSYQEAEKHKQWRTIMRAESNLPPIKKPIGYKLVFKTKYQSDGTIERHKARLDVLGNHQTNGEDFTDTYASVALMVSVHTFLAVVVAKIG